MEEKKFEEKRRYARLNIETKVSFRVKPKKQAEAPLASVSGVSRNISVEGICFRAHRQLAIGSELELEISIPSEPEPLLLKGEVKWSHPIQPKEKGKVAFDTGVKLFNIERSDENRYLRYVNEKMMERLSRLLHL